MIKNKILNTDNIVANRLKFVVDLINLNDIKNICDIGSWHLKQTIEFAEIFTDSNIYVFEANPTNYNICEKTYNTLDPQYKNRIHLYNMAVDNKDGKIKFYPVNPDKSLGYNPGASSKYKFIDGLNGSFFNESWIQDEIEVEAIKLDTWKIKNNIHNIDCIWIDVQGAELDVFKGGIELLKNVKIIFTELATKAYYDGQPLFNELNSFLESQGFFELKNSREDNVVGYEINTIYVKK